jgi:hypothetical protein
MTSGIKHGTPVGFEVLKAVVMKIAIFWNIAPFSPHVNRRFGGMNHVHLQGKESAEQETSVQQVARKPLVVTSQRLATWVTARPFEPRCKLKVKIEVEGIPFTQLIA